MSLVAIWDRSIVTFLDIGDGNLHIVNTAWHPDHFEAVCGASGKPIIRDLDLNEPVCALCETTLTKALT